MKDHGLMITVCIVYLAAVAAILVVAIVAVAATMVVVGDVVTLKYLGKLTPPNLKDSQSKSVRMIESPSASQF